jgi:hypothetical protein
MEYGYYTENEYQMMGVILNKIECQKLMRPINELCKTRGNLARLTPNFILYDKDIIGLKNIYDLQIENISKNLIYYANTNSEIGKIFFMQIKKLRYDLWTPNCIGRIYRLENTDI